MLTFSERTDDERAESRLRSAARRRGLRLVKSRSRTPSDWQYGTFMIVNDDNWLVAGNHNDGFGMTLEEVAEWLAE
jgi:hypothetical protein